ncbi:MAG TPA: M1 family metallopeptidase, partial [Cytophagales bacterium]|nr:M1 family metallopeptidase [Cytophagales bacterium]
MKHLVLFLCACILNHLTAQIYTGNYRSPQNPYYWKNKKPRADYWQQDVHYYIEATLDDSNDVISGQQRLVYYNNSEDTLKELFFHANENAFIPGSYYHNLHLNNHSKPTFGKNAAKGLGMAISKIKVKDSVLAPVMDNTVFKVSIPQPLAPNDSLQIDITFETYFDIDAGMRRRMKNFKTLNQLKHFDVVHWYPQVCVYDAKFGWTTDQHLDKEFYNNFGTFEVTLNLPQHYILDATGLLINEAEVYPDSLREQLKLSNFFNRKPNDPISRPIPYSPKLKTWRYRAVNVHNFAFTADPLYRIDEVSWNGIKAVALVQEQNAPRWKDAVKFAMAVIKVYSTDFGMYAWPKIIIADAKDGMEYPMLTLDNGYYPQNQQLLAHEIGHMWFYGMLGSNETYRASMDEGFTQFLTVWAMDKLAGASRERLHSNKFIKKRLKPYLTRYDRLYNPYLITAHKGYDESLNTHSCAFHGALRHGGNYGLVYYKTGVMLYNLKYVLGDSTFLKAMKYYVNTWKMCHPYPEDFRSAVIRHTHNDLNWFFDQWLESTKTLDYQVNRPKLLKTTKDSLTYELSLSRKGRMHSPLDITVTDASGKKYNYHIPNTWFVKPTQDQILPKWYGWDLLQPTYKAPIVLSDKIKSIEIDTTLVLADLDLRNNRWGKASPLKFNYFIPNSSTWDQTDKLMRPDLWYNAYDGLQIGLNFNKKYFASLTDYDLSAYVNTGVFQGIVKETDESKYNKLSYTFYSKSNFNKFLRYSYLTFYSNFIAGMLKNGISIEKIIRKQDDQNPRTWTLGANIDQMYRPRKSDLNYLLFNSSASVQQLHNTLNLFAERRYVLHKRTAQLRLDLRSPFMLSEFNYYYLQALHLYNTNYKRLEFRTRLFSRLAHSTTAIPAESALMLAGGNIEDSFNSKYYRARGIFPAEWQNPSSQIFTHLGGGLNVRGLSHLYY